MNISLIGMSGVGKSIIGKELANRLKYRFIDVDEIIEKKTGMRLQQIIDNSGDEEFLRIEEKSVLGLNDLKNCVISSGGSVVYSEKIMKFLKKNSVVVFLDASLESIKSKTDFSSRGIVGLKKKGLETLFMERLPLYRKYSDLTIEISKDDDTNFIIKSIIEKIKEKSSKK